MQIKNYFFSKFIYILSVEESFFIKKKFQKKVKFTDELINLNYTKNAPYRNPLFVKLMEDKSLSLWFYEEKKSDKIIIPESYLLTEYYKKQNPNALLCIKNSAGYLIVIIKESLLVNAYSVLEKDEQLIQMEMHQYALSSWKEITQDEYLKTKKKIVKNLRIKDVFKWVTITTDNRQLLPTLVNRLAYPLSFLLFFMIFIEVYHSNSLEKRLESAKESYLEAKNKNSEIREKINKENDKEQKWIDFVHKELPYANSLTIFTNISKAFEGKDVKFKSFSIVGSKLKLQIETKEDFIVPLKVLNSLKGLKQVELKYSNRKRNNATYEARIIAKGVAL